MSNPRRPSMDVPEIHVESAADDYTASIELSNACREFYRNRVKATEVFKQTMNSRNNAGCIKQSKRTSIDDAMEKLRTEMVGGTPLIIFIRFCSGFVKFTLQFVFWGSGVDVDVRKLSRRHF